jgi:ATP-binding cassette subfamily A (ABC1) protein 5
MPRPNYCTHSSNYLLFVVIVGRFSWAVVYTVIILAVCIILTILVAAMKILQSSNLGIFLLIIFLYGLTLITISFMLTPFFDRAQIAGAVASMATIVFGFLYLAISLTRYSLEPDGYLSSIPSIGQWLLGLFSPVALALSIDQVRRDAVPVSRETLENFVLVVIQV